MLHAIVEGEPGIFPDPVSRVLRAVGGLFRRDRDQGPQGREPDEGDRRPPPGPDDGDGERDDGGDGHRGPDDGPSSPDDGPSGTTT